METLPDYWLTQATDLAQPTRQIADYVEGEGFNVPKRYQTLEEALCTVRSGGVIVIRSEHPVEYDGPPSLRESHLINKKEIESGKNSLRRAGEDLDKQIAALFSGKPVYDHVFTDVASMVIGQILEVDPGITIERLKSIRQVREAVRDYTILTGQSADAFTYNTTYSYWEHMPGTDVTVVADSAIADQYYYFTRYSAGKYPQTLHSSRIVNSDGKAEYDRLGNPCNGYVSERYDSYRNDQQPETIKKIIEQYELIRSLGRFSTSNCPMIDMRLSDKGELYFQRYYRTQDFNPAPEPIKLADIGYGSGWSKAALVRGTLLGVKTLKMAIDYPDNYETYDSQQQGILIREEASSIPSYGSRAVNELLSKHRTMSVFNSHSKEATMSDISYAIGEPFSTPTARINWFNPQVSILLRDNIYWKLIPDSMLNAAFKITESGKVAVAEVDVIADGKSAFIRLNPEAQQPNAI